MNTCTKTCKTSLICLVIGIGIALLSLTPQGIYLEEEYGLPLLYKLRGPASPTKNVVIVSIDEISSQILHLPDDPEKWPRSYYAQLINRISQFSPSIIAFNLTFDENRHAKDDQLLADSIANAKNIILTNYLKHLPLPNSNIKIVRIIEPIPILENAALDTAPFLLPKTSTTVKQYWAFKNSAGNISTFPVTIFQWFAFKQAYSEILQLLHWFKPELVSQLPVVFSQHTDIADKINTMQIIQTAFMGNSLSLQEYDKLINTNNFSEEKKKILISWLNLLKRPTGFYFNFYGEAEQTITTIPFYQALVGEVLNPKLFRDKIVMIGYSKTIEQERTTGLYTVYSKGPTSPIEIAATAVANLVDNSWIKPLHPKTQFLLLLVWSLLLSILPRLLPYKHVLGIIFVLSLTYSYFAYTIFTTDSVWLPLFLPIFTQTPLILIFISIVYFFAGSKDHKKIQEVFKLYIPDKVISSITKNHDINSMNLYGELVKGVCMATDAGQYTTLAESINEQNLHVLINEYYAVMFPCVKNNEGIISDVVGDAMFAIWTDGKQEIKIRNNACIAALEIKTAINLFNLSQPNQLPTRLGIHFGNIRLGNVGADEHYEYRAVGDTVNTAARIEGLNKLLGTQILVSADVIKDLPQYLTRELGFFILKGKTQSVHIYELIDKIDQQTSHWQPLITEFSKALKLFQNQQWPEALAAWLAIETVYTSDGPTLFYINYLKQNNSLSKKPQKNNNKPTILKIGDFTTPLHYDE